jgi:hypothetical protein
MNTLRVGSLWGRRLAIALLALSVPVMCPLAGRAQEQGDPPARVARVSYLSGKVSLQPSGENQWSQASLNYPMTTNDRLYTDQGARAELDLGSTAVRLSEATDLTVANLNDQLMQFGLAQGTLRISVYELISGNTIEVDTPNGALTLQQGQYRVDTFPDDNTTLVSVYSGSVQLSGGGLNQAVQSGQAVKLTGTGPIQVEYVSLPAQDAFDQWCASRDQLFASNASAAYVSRETPGYDALNAFGVWTTSPQYGPVWYPTAVPAGWVPYQYGHWVWVNPWGWSWVDYDPWGFAPFHYGRWAYIGPRWCWVPGPVVVRPYYAPALVAFVGGAGFSVGIGIGGAGLAAWFPLGPREPFYPWYHCGNTYLRQVNVTNIRNYTFVNVTNVTNIHYVNEHIATTVVRANVFSSGAAVRSGIVHVNAAQLARAQVIPHPEMNPGQGAALGGRAVAAPVRAQRFTPAAARQRLASVRPIQGPANARVNPRGATPAAPARPMYQAPRTPAPRATAARAYTPVQRQAPGSPPNTRPRLITRNAPAPTSVPFSTKLRAMQSHPGRPLEPQQVNNLRAGRPAGPMRDREYIPHPSSRPAQRQSAPARPSKPASNKPARNERH